MENKYHSFLLRLWTTDQQNGEILWRASLESSETAKKQIFANNWWIIWRFSHSCPRRRGETPRGDFCQTILRRKE
jgi:hypothetical protein